MEFFAKQYYNAAQIVLTTLDKVLADEQAGHRRDHA